MDGFVYFTQLLRIFGRKEKNLFFWLFKRELHVIQVMKEGWRDGEVELVMACVAGKMCQRSDWSEEQKKIEAHRCGQR